MTGSRRAAIGCWIALACAFLAPEAPAAPGSWLPEGAPPAALSVRVSALTSSFARMLRAGTPDEPKLLQVEAFVTEGLHRVRADPPDRAIAVQFLSGDFEQARLGLAFPSASTTVTRAALYRSHLDFVGQRFETALSGYEELAEGKGNDAALARLMVGLCNLRMHGSEAGAMSDLVTVRASRQASGQPLGDDELLDLIWGQLLTDQVEQAYRTIQSVRGPLMDDPRLFGVYGDVLLKKGETARARDAYGTAIARGARDAETTHKFASLSMELKDADSAAAAQVSAEELYSRKQQRHPWFSRTAADVLAAAPAELRGFRLDQSERALKAVPPPWQARAQTYLADVEVLRAHPGPAADLYRDALSDDPLHVTTRVKATGALLLAGRTAEAFEVFLETVDLSVIPSVETELGALRVRYPEVFATMGDAFATYLYDAEKRVEANPADTASRRVMAAVFHALLFPDRALRAVTVNGRVAAGDPMLRRLWAMATWRDARQARRGLPETELKELASALTEALAHAPSAGAEYVLAQCLRLLRKPAEERAHLKKLMDSGYDAPSIVFALSEEAESRRDFAAVKALLDRLFRRDYESRTAAVARHRYLRALWMLGEANRK